MKQLEFARTKCWGGKRRGAGRPNKSGKVNHGKRERVSNKTPLHISIKLVPATATLRTNKLSKAFNRALHAAQKFGFKVNHYSLLDNHLHMIAEVENNDGLERGTKSLFCRFGKAIRRYAPGTGSVFNGRFHLHVLKTPREVKNALEYVLLNSSKHARRLGELDPYSSAPYFDGWKLLLGRKFEPLIHAQLAIQRRGNSPIGISPPESWLGRVGWQRACPA